MSNEQRQTEGVFRERIEQGRRNIAGQPQDMVEVRVLRPGVVSSSFVRRQAAEGILEMPKWLQLVETVTIEINHIGGVERWLLKPLKLS